MAVASMKESSILQGVARKGGFNASVTIIATDSTWDVPSLGSPIVKVTAIGGGGGGGANATNNGATGGTTTFDAGAAGTVTAAGGVGGFHATTSTDGRAGALGFASSNGGGPAFVAGATPRTATAGIGGLIVVTYLDLTGITEVNATIGAGGAGGLSGFDGGDGGRGEVIVEYVAGA